jgi:hypothetical protein
LAKAISELTNAKIARMPVASLIAASSHVIGYCMFGNFTLILIQPELIIRSEVVDFTTPNEQVYDQADGDLICASQKLDLGNLQEILPSLAPRI